MDKLTALIDGDILVYSVGFVSQIQEQVESQYVNGELIFEGGLMTIPSSWEETTHTTDCMINNICSQVEATDYKIYLSDTYTFRDDLPNIDYKGNRNNPKPYWYYAIRNYLLNNHGAEIGLDIEADDMMGIHQTDKTIICSIDKDLLQIPGRHFNWKSKEYKNITEQQGDMFKWRQVLSGDPIDNIPGLPKIGKQKAYNFVKMYYNDKDFVDKIKFLYILFYGPENGLNVYEDTVKAITILQEYPNVAP